MTRVRLAIAACLLAALAAAPGGRACCAQDILKTEYVTKGSFLQAPELQPLPPSKETPPAASAVQPLPSVDELPPPENQRDASGDVDLFEEVEPFDEDASGEADELHIGQDLLEVELLPHADRLFLKGEELMQAVEELSWLESWLVRPLQLWSVSLEFGMNGSSGTNDVFDMRFAGHVRRVTDRRRFTADVTYKFINQQSEVVTDRLYFEARNEWIIKNSRWSPYIHSTTEYDQIRAFGVQVAGDAGVGYHFYETPMAALLGRIGAGASNEFNSPDESVSYEAVFGFSYERRVTQRQRFAASADYFPGWDDFNTYRINMKAGWEVDIDEEGRLSLKLSANDRYDSTPYGAEPNNLDYAATILWRF